MSENRVFLDGCRWREYIEVPFRAVPTWAIRQAGLIIPPDLKTPLVAQAGIPALTLADIRSLLQGDTVTVWRDTY
jgi:hypothetical protein